MDLGRTDGAVRAERERLKRNLQAARRRSSQTGAELCQGLRRAGRWAVLGRRHPLALGLAAGGFGLLMVRSRRTRRGRRRVGCVRGAVVALGAGLLRGLARVAAGAVVRRLSRSLK